MSVFSTQKACARLCLGFCFHVPAFYLEYPPPLLSFTLSVLFVVLGLILAPMHARQLLSYIPILPRDFQDEVWERSIMLQSVLREYLRLTERRPGQRCFRSEEMALDLTHEDQNPDPQHLPKCQASMAAACCSSTWKAERDVSSGLLARPAAR